jgi:hypothetical protein
MLNLHESLPHLGVSLSWIGSCLIRSLGRFSSFLGCATLWWFLLLTSFCQTLRQQICSGGRWNISSNCVLLIKASVVKLSGPILQIWVRCKLDCQFTFALFSCMYLTCTMFFPLFVLAEIYYSLDANNNFTIKWDIMQCALFLMLCLPSEPNGPCFFYADLK